MVKKIFDNVSLFFRRTFSCFSLLTLAFAVVGMLIKTNEYSKFIASDLIVSFFVFSSMLALSFAISDLFKNSAVLKGFIRFILTFISLCVVFFAGGAFSNYVAVNGVQNKSFSILAISFVFVIIYVVCSLVTILAGFIKRKISEGDKEYISIFDNKE